MSDKAINIKKNYLITFINSLINMKYLNCSVDETNTLKDSFFPSEFSEVSFNEFTNLIDSIIILTIKQSFSQEEILNKIRNSHQLTITDDQIITIIDTIQKNKNSLNNKFNDHFYHNYNRLNGVNWKVKSLLASSFESQYTQKYSEVELNLNNNKNISLTLDKGNVLHLVKELRRIKDNITKIKEIGKNK